MRLLLVGPGQDDEHLVHQNNSAGNSSCRNQNDPYIIKLGAFSFDVRKNMMKAGNIDFTGTMSTSIIFHGDNLSKESELCQFKKPPDIRSKLNMGSNMVDVCC